MGVYAHGLPAAATIGDYSLRGHHLASEGEAVVRRLVYRAHLLVGAALGERGGLSSGMEI